MFVRDSKKISVFMCLKIEGHTIKCKRILWGKIWKKTIKYLTELYGSINNDICVDRTLLPKKGNFMKFHGSNGG